MQNKDQSTPSGSGEELREYPKDLLAALEGLLNLIENQTIFPPLFAEEIAFARKVFAEHVKKKYSDAGYTSGMIKYSCTKQEALAYLGRARRTQETVGPDLVGLVRHARSLASVRFQGYQYVRESDPIYEPMKLLAIDATQQFKKVDVVLEKIEQALHSNPLTPGE